MRRKLSFDDEKDLVLLGKALSSEIRIKILKLLDTKPYCVNEIAELLKIPAFGKRYSRYPFANQTSFAVVRSGL